MASVWQKTLFYLGLVDEDEATEEHARSEATTRHPSQQPQSRQEVEPPQYERRLQSRRRQPEPDVMEEPPRPRVAGRRVEPPLASRRRISSDPEHAEAGMLVGGSSSVRRVSESELECEVVTARSYSDAQLLADHIRSNQPVVLDLRRVEPAMVRRLVDFASGLTYALGGSMRKIGQGVILVTPANVNITRDERRRLAGLGYFESTEGS